MGYETEQIAVELAVVDRRIGEVKSELGALKEVRTELVERLADCIGPHGTLRLRTPAAVIEASPCRKVRFPTLSGSPEAREQLVRSLKSIGRYERFSTLNYSRLKSDWLNARVRGRVLRALRPFAAESCELAVVCRPVTAPRARGRATGAHQ